MKTNYLVPMWSHKYKQMKNHLALITAEDQYQAMLIAIGSHNHENGECDAISCNADNTEWHIDMNYEAYQECKDPEAIFTYMDRSVKIKSSKNNIEEEKTMDIYD